MSLSWATISSSHLSMFNDLNFLKGNHKKVSNYHRNLVMWVFWQNGNSVLIWHMILKHKPPSVNWEKIGVRAGKIKVTWVQSYWQSLQPASQPVSQVTVTRKSIFQLTLFTPAAAFSISIQVTRFSYWCIAGFMTEFSGGCCMWPCHISAGILRCQRADLRHQTYGDALFIF